MNTFKAFVKAARLRTLPLSVSGIIVGCGITNFYSGDEKNYTIFSLALLTTIAFQVLSNFANDYGDGIKGTDANRTGEQRMVASGIISFKKMKRAVVITSIISLILAVLLIYSAFGVEQLGFSFLFFTLGILAIIAAIKYTVGKSAYGYSGFGDVFVFLFFGWLSVVGSYFLYTKTIDWTIFLPATSIGLLSVAVLNLNNMRDRLSDIKANKITLVVKLGSQTAKKYHYILVLGALICAIIYVICYFVSIWQYSFLLAFMPLTHNLVQVYKNIILKDLDGELKKVALSTFLFAILFVIFN